MIRPLILRPLGIAALTLCHATAATGEDQPQLRLNQPIQQVWQLGDRIPVTFSLHAPEAYTLVAESLPLPGPISETLELTRVDWRKPSAPSADQLIQLDYLWLGGAQTHEVITLPSINLRLNRGNDTYIALSTPETTANVTALIAPTLTNKAVELRPLHTLPLKTPLPDKVVISAALLCITLCVAHLYPICHGTTQHPSFRSARKKLRRTLRKTKPACATTLVLKCVHQTLNAIAGYRVDSLMFDAFLDAHPCYAPVKDEICAFMQQSEYHFYRTTRHGVADAEISNISRWLKLIDDCCKLERKVWH